MYAKTPALQVQRDLLQAFTSLRSVHITGSFIDSGDRVAMDLSMDRDHHCVGSIDQAGQRMQLIGIDASKIYFTANQKTWTRQGGAGLGAVLAGRSVTGVPARTFGSACDLGAMVSDIVKGTTDLDPKAVVVGTGVGEGIQAVRLRAAWNGARATATVAAASPHYLLTMRQRHGQYLRLSQLNQPVHPMAPKKAANFNKLTGTSP